MEEQEIIRTALEYVKAAGAVGVDKTRLMHTVKNLDGTPLSPDQRDFLFGVLTGRGWITWYIDAVWHAKRWTLTSAGLTALEAM